MDYSDEPKSIEWWIRAWCDLIALKLDPISYGLPQRPIAEVVAEFERWLAPYSPNAIHRAFIRWSGVKTEFPNPEFTAYLAAQETPKH
jgi:hypothetical protein